MNYYGVTRSTDHLAHYGVKGMRWGVRKAIVSGNQRALERHYRRAARKLAKLQDIGLNSGKYAAKSIAYGAAAAGTGTLAVGGIKGLASVAGKIMKKPAFKKANRFLAEHPEVNKSLLGANKSRARIISSTKNNADIQEYYRIINSPEKLKTDIENFGNKRIALGKKKSSIVIGKDKSGNPVYGDKLITLPTNKDLYRIGTGVITAGLLAKSAQNAYRAANGKKYREKAVNWKREMDDAFAGTPYSGHYEKLPRRKRRR